MVQVLVHKVEKLYFASSIPVLGKFYGQFSLLFCGGAFWQKAGGGHFGKPSIILCFNHMLIILVVKYIMYLYYKELILSLCRVLFDIKYIYNCREATFLKVLPNGLFSLHG